MGVAVESWARNRSYARHAIQPTKLWDFHLPPGRESFAPGLVRPAITSIDDFYGMSKNTVDPVIQPMDWRLRITIDGHELRSFSFADLLALPRTVRDAVAELHLAGHEAAHGCLIDTHSRPVCDAVWALYADALERFGVRPTLLERDQDIPPLAELLAEVYRAADCLEACHVPA